MTVKSNFVFHDQPIVIIKNIFFGLIDNYVFQYLIVIYVIYIKTTSILYYNK